jgi:hypothetical protein
MAVLRLMVVHYFHIINATFLPYKADTPLVINANAALTPALTLERFKAITGRLPQVIKCSCPMKIEQFSTSGALDRTESCNKHIMK